MVSHPAFSFELAGVRFRLEEFQKAQVQAGDVLELRAEPQNPHDKAAIAVYKGQVMLGYVPRTHNWAMMEALKAGRLTCVASSVWSRGCWVKVAATDPDDEAKAT